MVQTKHICWLDLAHGRPAFGKCYKAFSHYKAALYAIQFSLLVPSPAVLPHSDFQRDWCKNVHLEGCLSGEFYRTKALANEARK